MIDGRPIYKTKDRRLARHFLKKLKEKGIPARLSTDGDDIFVMARRGELVAKADRLAGFALEKIIESADRPLLKEMRDAVKRRQEEDFFRELPDEELLGELEDELEEHPEEPEEGMVQNLQKVLEAVQGLREKLSVAEERMDGENLEEAAKILDFCEQAEQGLQEAIKAVHAGEEFDFSRFGDLGHPVAESMNRPRGSMGFFACLRHVRGPVPLRRAAPAANLIASPY